MATIRRGDQTTTDEWLAKRPMGEGAPDVPPTMGRIVWFRSVHKAKTGGPVEVPAIITQVRPGNIVDLTVFRANGLLPGAEVSIPYNANMDKAHIGSWRWPVIDAPRG